MAAKGKGHGGRRAGAGRPKGARMRRSDALADKLIAEGKCPVEALVRLAKEAEALGEIGQAIGAWRCILPYVYPKPKSVEVFPENVVELARELAEARSSTRVELREGHVAMLEKFAAELERGH